MMGSFEEEIAQSREDAKEEGVAQRRGDAEVGKLSGDECPPSFAGYETWDERDFLDALKESERKLAAAEARIVEIESFRGAYWKRVSALTGIPERLLGGSGIGNHEGHEGHEEHEGADGAGAWEPRLDADEGGLEEARARVPFVFLDRDAGRVLLVPFLRFLAAGEYEPCVFAEKDLLADVGPYRFHFGASLSGHAELLGVRPLVSELSTVSFLDALVRVAIRAKVPGVVDWIVSMCQGDGGDLNHEEREGGTG